MSENEQSLILPPPQQPSLPGVPAVSFFAELEAKGEFTGERLHQQRPDAYKAIVVLLGQQPPLGVIRIGKLLGVSPNTVMAVRDREGATVDIVREHLAKVAYAGATLASEGIAEALNEKLQKNHALSIRDLKDIAVVYGILVQNGQLLAGLPTARLEVNELRAPEHEDFNRYLAGLPQANATHSDGKKSGQKDGAPIVLESETVLAAPAPASAPLKTETDSQSEALPIQGAEPQQTDPT